MAGQIPAQTKTAQGNTVKITVFENDPRRVVLRGWYNGEKYVSTAVDAEKAKALLLADARGAVKMVYDDDRKTVYEVAPPYSLLLLQAMGARVPCAEIVSEIKYGVACEIVMGKYERAVITVDGGAVLIRKMASTFSVLAARGLVESVLQEVYGADYVPGEIADVALTGYGIYRVNRDLYMLALPPADADYALEDVIDVVDKVHRTGEAPFDVLNRVAARMVYNAYKRRDEDGDPVSWIIIKAAVRHDLINEQERVAPGVVRIRIGGAWYRLEWNLDSGVYRYTWEPPADAE